MLFGKEKTNAEIKVQTPLQPKGFRFKPFLKFSFSCINDMDENKLSWVIF
jgi:hypothetical protein